MIHGTHNQAHVCRCAFRCGRPARQFTFCRVNGRTMIEPMNAASTGHNLPHPLPPKGTRLNGKALWSAVLDRYELEHQERALLREIVRSVDELDQLADAVSRHGVVTPRGVLNPAVSEARQLRVALASLVAALRLPAGAEADDGEASVRRPRRYPPVRSIDAPRSGGESASRRNDSRSPAATPTGGGVTQTRARHSRDRSGGAVAVSVADLYARIGDRPVTPIIA